MVYHLYTIYDTMVHKYNIYTMLQLLKIIFNVPNEWYLST